jgi:hypothetical protein
MRWTGPLELVLELMADLVLVTCTRLKESAMNVVSLRRMSRWSLPLVLAAVPGVRPVPVVLPVQEVLVLLDELEECSVLVPMAEVSESKSSCTGILALYQILQ